MFTGLVQAVGQLQLLSDAVRVVWPQRHSALQLADLSLGDSVAVDGVCLTVRRICSDGFEACLLYTSDAADE